MREITEEEACRTEHLPDCVGYEDCQCFSDLWSHADIYAMQKEINQLRQRICELRGSLQKLAHPQSGDIATDYELEQI